jgi:hypothetical protein
MPDSKYEFGESEPEREIVTGKLTELGRAQLVVDGIRIQKENIHWIGIILYIYFLKKIPIVFVCSHSIFENNLFFYFSPNSFLLKFY